MIVKETLEGITERGGGYVCHLPLPALSPTKNSSEYFQNWVEGITGGGMFVTYQQNRAWGHGEHKETNEGIPEKKKQ